MKHISILLGEDSQSDAVYALKVFTYSSYKIDAKHLNNGELLINYLRELENDPEVKLPDLILLDINMPIKTGLEVLSYIKSSNHIKNIPVVLLTISKSEYNQHLSKSLKADYYMVKPLDIEVLDAIIGQINKYRPGRFVTSA